MAHFLAIAISLVAIQDAQKEPPSKPTINDIKTAWDKSLAKTKTIRFQWSETRQKGTNDPTTFTYSVFLQHNDNLRVERSSTQFDPNRKRIITNIYVTTYNGREARSFYGRDFVDSELYPSGFVSFDPSDWDNYHLFPVLFAVRPINNQFSPINQCEYVVADKHVEVAGRKLLKLAPAKIRSDEPNVQYIYFVDPDKDFAIARVTKNRNDRKLWQLDVVSYRQQNKCWLPVSWKLQSETTNEKCTVSDAQFELDTTFANDQFLFQFPKHTLITDRTFTKPLVYILRDDLRKRIISSEERRGGIKYLKYLAAIRAESKSDR